MTHVGRIGLLLIAFFVCGGGILGCSSDAKAPATAGEESGKDSKEMVYVPVPFGDYNINEIRPNENVKLQMAFSIQLLINELEKPKFEKLFADRQHMLRDQVIVAVRSAETFEFDEPKLEWIRKRIRMRIEPFMKEIAIQDIYFTDFACQID